MDVQKSIFQQRIIQIQTPGQCESFFQEIISSEHLDEIKVTTPPCLPEAGDLKLRPGHLRDRDLMVDSELIKVS